MNTLNIEGTYYTPKVEYTPSNGTLEIEGRALETDKGNDEDVFTRISAWVNTHLSDKKQPMLIKFRLSYYNTTSSKKMVKFMRSLDGLFQQGYNVKIMWEYEDGDEDALSDGEVFKKLFTVPISIAKV
jgi:hypothetical protein